MPTYRELNALPADHFLNPDNFVTDYDCKGAPYMAQQYQKGLDTGREFAKLPNGKVGISANGTWFASADGQCLTSYEGIGYHAGTADLLRGLLDSGAEVWIYRQNGTKTRIK